MVYKVTDSSLKTNLVGFIAEQIFSCPVQTMGTYVIDTTNPPSSVRPAYLGQTIMFLKNTKFPNFSKISHWKFIYFQNKVNFLCPKLLGKT